VRGKNHPTTAGLTRLRSLSHLPTAVVGVVDQLREIVDHVVVGVNAGVFVRCHNRHVLPNIQPLDWQIVVDQIVVDCADTVLGDGQEAVVRDRWLAVAVFDILVPGGICEHATVDTEPDQSTRTSAVVADVIESEGVGGGAPREGVTDPL
jgi:hypothetical protein